MRYRHVCTIHRARCAAGWLLRQRAADRSGLAAVAAHGRDGLKLLLQDVHAQHADHSATSRTLPRLPARWQPFLSGKAAMRTIGVPGRHRARGE